MSEADKSIYGRKVFFGGANATFDMQVASRLRLMEYEVYTISDYRKVKPLLRKNADSICFCLVENQLSLKGWHNFIKSFENESVFAPLDVGVIIPDLPDEKKTTFISGLQLDAGILSLDLDPEVLFHEIVKALDAKKAKGMRKYVRASCINEPNADILWVKDSRMFKLKIIDISSVVIAAMLSMGQANAVFINQIIENVTLNLKNVQIVVDLKIDAIKSAGDFLLVVGMFTTSTVPAAINEIREYVAQTLQQNLFSMVRGNELDRTDYERFE